MSSFVAATLKATVGLLENKGRNVAVEKLKEGDVSNEQLRNLIVRLLLVAIDLPFVLYHEMFLAPYASFHSLS